MRVITRMNVGGPSFHVLHVSRALAARGVETLLVHGSVGPGEGSLARKLEEHGIPNLPVRELVRPPSARRDAIALRGILGIIRRFRPHVVHTHLAKAGAIGRVAARISRVPGVFHTYHGHVFHGYFPPVVSAGVVRAERLLARFTDRILVPGTVLREEILRYGIADPDRVLAQPLAVDWKEFDRDSAAPTPRKGTVGGATVGIVGRLVPVKGHATLFRSLAILVRQGIDVRLRVIGDGPERESLGRLADRLGLGDRIAFDGYVENRLAVYRSIDALVLPSSNEGAPVTLMEAMRSGVPVVASRVGGVPEIVEDGRTGLLVPPGDAEGLACALRVLIEDRARGEDLARAARETARERFDPERLVSFLLDQYHRILETKGTGSRCG